jgi:hypothetical protein
VNNGPSIVETISMINGMCGCFEYVSLSGSQDSRWFILHSCGYCRYWWLLWTTEANRQVFVSAFLDVHLILGDRV